MQCDLAINRHSYQGGHVGVSCHALWYISASAYLRGICIWSTGCLFSGGLESLSLRGVTIAKLDDSRQPLELYDVATAFCSQVWGTHDNTGISPVPYRS
jgi:hypothetical protein